MCPIVFIEVIRFDFQRLLPRVRVWKQGRQRFFVFDKEYREGCGAGDEDHRAYDDDDDHERVARLVIGCVCRIVTHFLGEN